jgi:hypothetical protein
MPEESKKAPPKSEATDSGEEAERALARAVAWGLPGVTLVAAIAVGVAGSLGSALLVMASGVMLGAISLLWASLRTLSGEAPLPGEASALATRSDGSDLAERKLRVILALKDIESERALGKIDEADYVTLVARYREEAKAVMREMDHRVDPSRAEAERVADEFLAQHGYGTERRVGGAHVPPPPPPPDRVECRSCRTSNEVDAAFCKSCGASMKNARESRDAKV